MTAHPIDIIANAIADHPALDAADDRHVRGGSLAGVVAKALTDPAIVDHVVRALKDAGWGHDHIHVIRLLDDVQLVEIARVVLRSVAEEA